MQPPSQAASLETAAKSLGVAQVQSLECSGTGHWFQFGQAPAAANANSQPAAVEERNAEIWSAPQGFLKAALAKKASSRPANGGVEVSFNAGKYRYVGWINGQDRVERVRTWIDNPILGDPLWSRRASRATRTSPAWPSRHASCAAWTASRCWTSTWPT